MPLILDRTRVLEVYAEARERKWVLPTFNAENLTTAEAILQAVKDYGTTVGSSDLPVIIGITNTYRDRPQSVYYTHTRDWRTGLRLFLADLEVLASAGSPFSDLRVLIHLDHIIWDEDKELLDWDMKQFSSIMYDASSLSFDSNMQQTAAFVEKHGHEILIEGACDAISKEHESDAGGLTTPDMAEQYFKETGVDIIVPNLGTEHRASASTLCYHDDLAREISLRTGPNLCLHGTSSVSKDKLTRLFEDGICKVNMWTALERDSSRVLLARMLRNAASIAGPDLALQLRKEGLLGDKSDCESLPSIDYYTTTFRQGIVFQCMKEIITGYLKLWYVSPYKK
ncbi:MAG: class II fructose-bisphosphate aldolase [Balneolales bacterium]